MANPEGIRNLVKDQRVTVIPSAKQYDLRNGALSAQSQLDIAHIITQNQKILDSKLNLLLEALAIYVKREV